MIFQVGNDNSNMARKWNTLRIKMLIHKDNSEHAITKIKTRLGVPSILPYHDKRNQLTFGKTEYHLEMVKGVNIYPEDLPLIST